jgi:hypothetical protein
MENTTFSLFLNDTTIYIETKENKETLKSNEEIQCQQG